MIDHDELTRLCSFCESPIETIMLWLFLKYKAPGVQVETQRYLKTKAGIYRADFVLSIPEADKTCVVECDGRDFHKNLMKDLKRDKAIISSWNIPHIWRLPGWAIFKSEHLCCYLISKFDPWIFSPRALVNLRTYAGGAEHEEIAGTHETLVRVSQHLEHPTEPMVIQIQKRDAKSLELISCS